MKILSLTCEGVPKKDPLIPNDQPTGWVRSPHLIACVHESERSARGKVRAPSVRTKSSVLIEPRLSFGLPLLRFIPTYDEAPSNFFKLKHSFLWCQRFTSLYEIPVIVTFFVVSVYDMMMPPLTRSVSVGDF